METQDIHTHCETQCVSETLMLSTEQGKNIAVGKELQVHTKNTAEPFLGGLEKYQAAWD